MLEQINKHLPANRDKQRIALIDGDIIKYRVGFASQTTLYRLYLTEKPEGYTGPVDPKIPLEFEGKTALNDFIKKYELDPNFLYWEEQIVPDSIDKCLHSVKMTIERVQNSLQADQTQIFLSGKGNFREEVAQLLPYKGNRKDIAKPYHYQDIHDYLVNVWNAKVVEGMEADDALGIAQWHDFNQKLYKAFKEQPDDVNDYLKKNCKTFIVTLDKDLDMIPGWHYNWTKSDPSGADLGELYWVTQDQALKNFFSQVLSGDSVDNIPGIRGIGQKKALKALEGLTDAQSMYDKVLDKYIEWVESWEDKLDDVVEEAERRMDEAAQLVWILRTNHEKGEVPYYHNTHMEVEPRVHNGKENTSVSRVSSVDDS